MHAHLCICNFDRRVIHEGREVALCPCMDIARISLYTEYSFNHSFEGEAATSAGQLGQLQPTIFNIEIN